MPVDISLHNAQHGRLETVVYPRDVRDDLIPYDDPSYELLSTIDPGDHTFFAQAQMPAFLAEWRRLSADAEPEEQEFLGDVERMALACEREPGYYLKFDGD